MKVIDNLQLRKSVEFYLISCLPCSIESGNTECLSGQILLNRIGLTLTVLILLLTIIGRLAGSLRSP